MIDEYFRKFIDSQLEQIEKRDIRNMDINISGSFSIGLSDIPSVIEYLKERGYIVTGVDKDIDEWKNGKGEIFFKIRDVILSVHKTKGDILWEN